MSDHQRHHPEPAALKRCFVEPVLILLAVAIVAAIPRFAGLEHPSFTNDELNDYLDSVRYQQQGKWNEPISDGYMNGQFPFYVTDGAYRFFGMREWTARAVSAMFGVVAVVLSCVLAARLFGWRWGGVAALLLALSPYHITASRLAFSHGHVHFTVFFLGALILLHDAVVETMRPHVIKLALLGLAMGLSVGTDMLCMPWVALMGVGVVAKGLVRRVPWWWQTLLWAACLVLGVFLSSPMFFFSPLNAVQQISSAMKFWDSITGYMWLGRMVERIPPTYYPVVLAVRLSPWIAVCSLIGLCFVLIRSKQHPLLLRLLPLALLPVAYLTIRPWKNPFYLAPILPIVFVFCVAPLHALGKAIRTTRARAIVVATAAFLVIGQLLHVVVAHPDYLIDGIQYGPRFYGQFQGPAISHGQWVKEALQCIRIDADGGPANVIVFETVDDAAWDQLLYYAGPEGATLNVYGNFAGPDEALEWADYVLFHYEGMYPMPAGDTPRRNGPLLHLIASRGEIRKFKTFGPPRFPLATVYRVDSSSPTVSE